MVGMNSSATLCLLLRSSTGSRIDAKFLTLLTRATDSLTENKSLTTNNMGDFSLPEQRDSCLTGTENT